MKYFYSSSLLAININQLALFSLNNRFSFKKEKSKNEWTKILNRFFKMKIQQISIKESITYKIK